MTQKPTIGRVVHYVLANGQHRKADVINAGWNEYEPMIATLAVTLDAHKDMPGGRPDRSNDLTPEWIKELFGAFYSMYGRAIVIQVDVARYDEETKAPLTWHYPEREA